MMAAITAARQGLSVAVFEKNRMLGRKLRITGKGRCNITNACDFDTLIENIPGGGKFMYSSFRAFSNYDLIDFFEQYGKRAAGFSPLSKGGRCGRVPEETV